MDPRVTRMREIKTLLDGLSPGSPERLGLLDELISLTRAVLAAAPRLGAPPEAPADDAYGPIIGHVTRIR
jgi:hypothetical protein